VVAAHDGVGFAPFVDSSRGSSGPALEAEQTRVLEAALLAGTLPKQARAGEGDPERMRNLPVVAHGVGGAQPRSRPGGAASMGRVEGDLRRRGLL
jgi:hypothetical protein